MYRAIPAWDHNLVRIHGILAVLIGNALAFRIESLDFGLYSAEVRVGIRTGGSGIVSRFEITYRMIVSRSSQLINMRNIASSSPCLLDINVKVYLQCRIKQLVEPTKREKAGQWP